MRERLISWFFLFPFRLFFNHIKENFVLSLSWLILIFILLEKIGADYGIPILFLNPEYINVVGYFSFQLVGMSFGAFYITWNLVTYLLYSYRYPFMATLKWPFAMFTLNNSIIPFYFFLFYIIKVIHFQSVEMNREVIQIFWMVLGLIAGFALTLLIVSVYFLFTNKTVEDISSNKEEYNADDVDNWDVLSGEIKPERVEFFLSRKLRFRKVRDVKHYPVHILKRVFQQHHLNAFIVIVINTLVLVGLGFVIDNPFFEIPAAGAVFLFFGLIISLAGLIYYWSGRWGAIALIAVILLLNFVSQAEWFQSDSQAYGLNYDYKSNYSQESLELLCLPDFVDDDINQTLSILNKWKEKNKVNKPYYYKPKMCIVLASGGGSRSAAYTLKIIQSLDSLSNGEFMDHTILMSGASGGMLGLAYYRELYLRNKMGIIENPYDDQYYENICGDMINKITTTIVSNDLFFGFQKYKYDDKVYNFDRGSSFEIAFNNYTDHVLDKPISDYKNFESTSTIPMMYISTINVADYRKFVISPQPVSFMMRAYDNDDPANNDDYEIDAIDFGAMFSQSDAQNLKMTSALRMNATYPLILPNVSLPSQPKIDVFDAGIRDNYGLENALRFVSVFQDWIKYNTSGVVIIQIRDNVKKNPIEDYEYESFMAKLSSSFGSVYSNLTSSQDYFHDYMLQGINDNMNNEIEVINFEYRPAENEKKVSMSLRLSEKEKKKVYQSAINEINQKKFIEVIELLTE